MKKLFLLLTLFSFVAFGCAGMQPAEDYDDIRAATRSAGIWSNYDELAAGNIADTDDFMLRDTSDTSMAATGTQKRLSWLSLKQDLATISGLEFPNNTDCTQVADNQAEACHDNNNPALVIHDNTNARVYASRTKCLPPVIIHEPDLEEQVASRQFLYNFPAEEYPAGVVIEAIHVFTSITCTDTVSFQEVSNNGVSWSEDSTIESMNLSGVYTEDDGTLSDSTIAADHAIRVTLDSPTANMAYIGFQFCIQIPVNN